MGLCVFYLHNAKIWLLAGIMQYIVLYFFIFEEVFALGCLLSVAGSWFRGFGFEVRGDGKMVRPSHAICGKVLLLSRIDWLTKK